MPPAASWAAVEGCERERSGPSVRPSVRRTSVRSALWDASVVRNLGWPYPFRQTPWPDIATFLGGMAERNPSFQHMADIVNSVIDSGSSDLLAAFTSMHDLMALATPIPDLPFDLVAVRAPGSLHPPSAHGLVLIEHLATTGNNDRIERPAAEAVGLFWRFMIEKFGVHPAVSPKYVGRQGSPGDRTAAHVSAV